MIKYDYDATASYKGGVVGSSQPRARRSRVRTLKDNPGAVTAYEQHTNKLSDKITAAVEKAVPDATIGTSSYQAVYGGVAAKVPANQVARAACGSRRRRSAEGHAEPAARRQHRRSSARRPCGRRSAAAPNAGSNVIVGDIDTGVWPEHPMLAQGSLGAPAGGLKACQFGDGTDVAHLGPTFTCNNKLIGAYAKTATYMANTGAGAEEFCNNTTHQCSARDSEGHGTHTTTTAAGDCVASAMLYGVERGPVCGIAPGARVIEYRVCLRSRLLRLRLGGGGAAGDPRRRQRDQLLDLGRRAAVLRRGRARVPRRLQRGDLGQRLGRQQRPGCGDVRPRRPVGDDRGRLDGPACVRLYAAPDGRRRRDAQRSGVTLTNGISTATPVVMAATLPKAGGGLEDALCQSDLAAGRGDRQGRCLPARHERPHRQGPQGPRRAARPG